LRRLLKEYKRKYPAGLTKFKPRKRYVYGVFLLSWCH
jgi:hypothetical protein